MRLEGEGYFEVARNVGCPFTVRTDVLDVTVLGTSFNVQAYADARTVEVDLLKGRVEVAAADGRRLSLLPDRQARFDRTSGLFESHPAVTALAADWINGRLSFVNTPFREILDKLQRHFNVRIEVSSEKKPLVSPSREASTCASRSTKYSATSTWTGNIPGQRPTEHCDSRTGIDNAPQPKPT